jgi:hypothetical protein
MITNFLWLFKAYRDLVFENARLHQIIIDLERQLIARPDTAVADMLRKHQEDTLKEQPFPDGVIPDNLWLT